jgi:transcriptional regulator with XRE-family HTH domain
MKVVTGQCYDARLTVKANRRKIGEYVRSRRLKSGLSLRLLSSLSGLTPTQLFNIEAGTSDPRFGAIEKLAKAFEESVPKFLQGFYSR